VTYGEELLGVTQLFGVAARNHRELPIGQNPEQGEVENTMGPEYKGIEFGAVGELDFNSTLGLPVRLDDMARCYDQPRGIDDEAGAEAPVAQYLHGRCKRLLRNRREVWSLSGR
jgi:hypothetical protein